MTVDSDMALPDGHAEAMLGSLSLVLTSRRFLTYHHTRHSSLDQRRLESAWRKVDVLSAMRDRWALRLGSGNPEFWITVYTRLLEQYTILRDQLHEEADGMSELSRQRVLLEDVPALDSQIASFRARLRHWRVAL